MLKKLKYLKKLKSKHGLSILALAHTPKRDATKPLGRNDLQGSKMLINFALPNKLFDELGRPRLAT